MSKERSPRKGERKKGQVAQKISGWSDEQFTQHQLTALEAEAEKRGLKLAGHVGLNLTFREYVTQLHPLLMNGQEFQWHDHNVVIAKVLEEVLRGERHRVMFWLPPRQGKSTLVQYFSAYYLSHFPNRWVGLSSYNQDLANTLSKIAKRAYQVPGYPLSADSKSVEYWETGLGGGMWAAGSDGAQLGKGYSLGIIDDPSKTADHVDSPAAQQRLYNWYSSTFSTRRNIYAGAKPAVIVIQQRLGNYDLSGWLLSRPSPEPWHVVCCEAVKEEFPIELPPNCTLEPDDRQPGVLLVRDGQAGELFAEEVREKRESDPFTFHSLFQQRPHQAQGHSVDKDDFQIIRADQVPKLKFTVRAWDTQAKKTSRDWTAGVLLGMCEEGNLYVLHVDRFREDATDVYERIVQRAIVDGDDSAVAIEEVGVSAQTVQELKRDRRLWNYQIVPIKVGASQGNLLKRSMALFNKIQNKMVYLVEGAWNYDFVNEFTRFSGSRNDTDDQISACTIGMTATLGRRGSANRRNEPEWGSMEWRLALNKRETVYNPARW